MGVLYSLVYVGDVFEPFRTEIPMDTRMTCRFCGRLRVQGSSGADIRKDDRSPTCTSMLGAVGVTNSKFGDDGTGPMQGLASRLHFVRGFLGRTATIHAGLSPRKWVCR